MTRTQLWTPSKVQSTNMDRFRRHVNAKHALNLKTYHDLHAWSTHPSTLGDFWTDAIEFLEIRASSTSGPALSHKPDKMFPPAQFFPDATLNLAEILLRRANTKDLFDSTAIIAVREGQPTPERVTWRSLRDRVRQVYDSMLTCGIKEGDRVAAVVSNSVDAVVICLATLALGAVYSSTSPDMGPDAVTQRFGQIQPKLVFTESGYVYAGKHISLIDRNNTWVPKLRSECGDTFRTVILPHLGTGHRADDAVGATTWEDFCALGTGRPLQFAQLPFSSPGFILFTSGTTGMPKCIVHSAGAAALKILVDQQLHNDVRPGDVVLQYTTTAWVMWVFNFVLLATGATIVLYDGSPCHPQPTQLLRLIDDFGVTVFGTSPKYLSELHARNVVPREQFSIKTLRTVTSTGSVLSASQCEWFYRVGFHPSTHLISMCGGTDLMGCFVGGTPTLPVFAGEIQAKALGMAVDVLDATSEEAISVERLGQQGELVCRQPFPSQPLEFYGHNGLQRYRKAYFEKYGNSIWQQGDFVQVLPDTKGIIVFGRSDGVLNPSGVRFGPADIYNVTEKISVIIDAICVGRQLMGEADEKVILFVKLLPATELDKKLQSQIRQEIGQKLSRRHVPRYIFQIQDIPYTINGKKCESHVKNIMNGRKPPASVTMSNPECLEQYKRYHHLLLRENGQVAQGARL